MPPRARNALALNRYRYRLVDVFTTSRFQGNPLAVFPAADTLDAEQMQRMANELNLSETVFLMRPQTAQAAARARIFTPRRELDFAGHPTIGSAFVLSREGGVPERFAIEENAGLVPVELENGRIPDHPVFWLTTPKIQFFETLDVERCAKLLGVSAAEIDDTAPPQFVSAGSPLLFICLRNVKAVDSAHLDLNHLEDAIGSVNSVGTFVYSRKQPNSPTSFDVYSRMFAPQSGIAEDPATGGASGPLAAFMLENGQIPNADLLFTSEQGVKMGRRSVIYIRVTPGAQGPIIRIGGCVAEVADGTFLV